MAKKIETGDIFYWKLESQSLFIFGRILFDVDLQVEKPIGNSESYFTCYTGCQLVEIYKGIYTCPEVPDTLEILIPRVFVFRIDVKANKLQWGKAGYMAVDFTKVEFPEVVGNAYNEVRLMRGELYFKTSIKDPVAHPGILPGAEFPVVILDAALWLQGREDLIEGKYYPESLTDLDLHYHPQARQQIYHDLKIDPDKSYYELAKEMGFDLGRLYRK
ncbi:hypothetical protein ACTJJS_13220 [Chitinophaga sp. 22308]